MSLTPSAMLPLGTQAPDFRLFVADRPASGAKTVSRKDFIGKPLLVVFMCNHCPYVVHLKKDLAALGRELAEKGVAMVGINSNDIENYPEDHPDEMKADVRKFGYTFPYLFDATQEIAKAYRAACTPDFFLFDTDHKLVYRGRYDDSRPGNGKPLTGRDLKNAVQAMLSSESVSGDQQPSLGCNIKWKP